MKKLALGRVDVLAAQGIVLVQLARLEADDASACVAEREHEPALEVVAATAAQQPGRGQLFAREPLLPRPLAQLRGGRGEPEAELAADLFAQAPRRQVPTHGLSRRRLPEHALVERRSLVEQRVEPLAAMALGVC